MFEIAPLHSLAQCCHQRTVGLLDFFHCHETWITVTQYISTIFLTGRLLPFASWAHIIFIVQLNVQLFRFYSASAMQTAVTAKVCASRSGVLSR